MRDATDAISLVDDLTSKGAIILSPTQRNVVIQGLDDVALLSRREKPWWIAKLGLN